MLIRSWGVTAEDAQGNTVRLAFNAPSEKVARQLVMQKNLIPLHLKPTSEEKEVDSYFIENIVNSLNDDDALIVQDNFANSDPSDVLKYFGDKIGDLTRKQNVLLIDVHLSAISEISQHVDGLIADILLIGRQYGTIVSDSDDASSIQLEQLLAQEEIRKLQEVQTYLLMKQESERQKENEVKQLFFILNDDKKNALAYEDNLSKYFNLLLIKIRLAENGMFPELLTEIQDKEYAKKSLKSINYHYREAYDSLTKVDIENLVTLEKKKQQIPLLFSKLNGLKKDLKNKQDELQCEIKKLKDELEKPDSEIMNLSKRAENINPDIEGLDQKLRKLERELKRLEFNLDFLKQPQQRLGWVFSAFVSAAIILLIVSRMSFGALSIFLFVVGASGIIVGIVQAAKYFFTIYSRKTERGQEAFQNETQNIEEAMKQKKIEIEREKTHLKEEIGNKEMETAQKRSDIQEQIKVREEEVAQNKAKLQLLIQEKEIEIDDITQPFKKIEHETLTELAEHKEYILDFFNQHPFLLPLKEWMLPQLRIAEAVEALDN